MSTVEIVLPVYNEERVLESSIRTLHTFLTDNLTHDWRITIADNGSKDTTLGIATLLANELPKVTEGHLPGPGRRRALSQAWLQSDADVLAYMDIDLSTGLES